jgi:hypothetical protein
MRLFVAFMEIVCRGSDAQLSNNLLECHDRIEKSAILAEGNRPLREHLGHAFYAALWGPNLPA